jgi:hypothetical protein
MRISLKFAIGLLVPLLVVGCDHKDKAQAPPQALAPPIVDLPPEKPAAVSKADLPPPVIGEVPPPKPPDVKPVEQPKKPARKPAKKPATTPPVDTASVTPPATTPPAGNPSVSAAGNLSGGGSADLKSETEESINNTEKGVNGVTRPLTDAELKTVGQIRDYLKQARDALTTGDVEGAQTLNKKARVLLTELTQ